MRFESANMGMIAVLGLALLPGNEASAAPRQMAASAPGFTDIDLSQTYSRGSAQYKHFYDCKESSNPSVDCNATGPARLYEFWSDTQMGNSHNSINRCLAVGEAGIRYKGPLILNDTDGTVDCNPGAMETNIAYIVSCVERADGIGCQLSTLCFEGSQARSTCPPPDGTSEIIRVVGKNHSLIATVTGTGAGTGAGTSAGASAGTGTGTSSGSSAGSSTGSSTGSSAGSSTGSSTGSSAGSSTGSSAGTSAGTATGSGTGSPSGSTVYELANDVSLDIRFTLTRSVAGDVYYAVYDADQGTLSPSDVKAAALSAPSGALAQVGTVNLTMAGVPVVRNISGLPEKKIYTIYAVGESSGILDAEVKKYSGVLPKRISLETYPTAIAGKGGITMRYGIAVPKDYYVDESRTWPVILYIGGGGETFNDASNAESNYYTGNAAIPVKTPFFSRILSGADDVPMIQVAMGCNSAYFSCVGMSESSQWRELIDQISSTYRVNTKKLYAVGMSWGGTGIYYFAQQNPGYLAAAISLAGGNPLSNGQLCSAFAGGGYHTPIWAMVNRDDTWTDDVNVTQAITTINACPGYAGSARSTVFDNTEWPSTTGSKHFTIEYVLNTPVWNYDLDRFRYWNGTVELNDTNPPTRRVPIEPKLQSELNALGFNHVWEWLNQFSKP